MYKEKLLILLFALVGFSCMGCSSDLMVKPNNAEVEVNKLTSEDNEVTSSQKELNRPNENDVSKDEVSEGNEELVYIHVFEQEDVAIYPEVIEYNFEKACNLGSIQEIDGMLPGIGEGTWYVIEIEGVEYYFGKYDFEEIEDVILYGYSILNDKYSLLNGITVGMAEDEILDMYPNMAVIDFENNYLYKEVVGHQGWNGSAYPRSYINMDDNWEYNGKDYYWSNQFDYLIIANINIGELDTLPIYLALLMKDNLVAGITFYYPTAD